MGAALKYPAAIPTLDELAMRSDRVRGLAPQILTALLSPLADFAFLVALLSRSSLERS
jgi:hypothetical protein